MHRCLLAFNLFLVLRISLTPGSLWSVPEHGCTPLPSPRALIQLPLCSRNSSLSSYDHDGTELACLLGTASRSSLNLIFPTAEIKPSVLGLLLSSDKKARVWHSLLDPFSACPNLVAESLVSVGNSALTLSKQNISYLCSSREGPCPVFWSCTRRGWIQFCPSLGPHGLLLVVAGCALGVEY